MKTGVCLDLCSILFIYSLFFASSILVESHTSPSQLTMSSTKQNFHKIRWSLIHYLSKVKSKVKLGALNLHYHLGAENSLLCPSFLELRNWGGNVSKQLAQSCHPME